MGRLRPEMRLAQSHSLFNPFIQRELGNAYPVPSSGIRGAGWGVDAL